jgi:hypothetical protein
MLPDVGLRSKADAEEGKKPKTLLNTHYRTASTLEVGRVAPEDI